jgi:hypothetical protein
MKPVWKPVAIRKLEFQLSLIAKDVHCIPGRIIKGDTSFQLWNVCVGNSLAITYSPSDPQKFLCRTRNEYKECSTTEQAVLFAEKHLNQAHRQQRLELN